LLHAKELPHLCWNPYLGEFHATKNGLSAANERENLLSSKISIQGTDGKDLVDVSNPKRSAKCEPPRRFGTSGGIGAVVGLR